jgi:hypothetical protein
LAAETLSNNNAAQHVALQIHVDGETEPERALGSFPAALPIDHDVSQQG